MEKRPATPNFLIAGSGESGTSWLYACLLQHPEIYLPKSMRPEPHFFFKSAEYAKGFDYYLERYFSNVPPEAKAVGERSSSYMFGDEVAERIFKHLPDVKIILLLREPVERAYSNWRFTVQSGLEWKGFESAIKAENRRIEREKNLFWKEVKPYAYLARSLYGPQVARFFEVFPKKNILVLNSDTAKRKEPEILRRVCGFLSVDENFQFESPGTFPTSSVKSKLLQCILRKAAGKDFDILIENTRTVSEQAPAKRILKFILERNLTNRHPKLSLSTRRKLEEQFYASNKQLSQYVDWDPFNWMEIGNVK